MSQTHQTIRVLLLSLITLAVANGQGTGLLTGDQLQTEMNRSGTIIWSDSPIRDALSSITNNRRVPIWIDRRCDPHQAITMVNQAPLVDCFWELSETKEEFDVAWSRDIVYVGPPDAADRWATVHLKHREMLKALPLRQRQKWMTPRPWKWARLTNPQELLKQLEAELGHEIQGREQVLHDLWPSAEYPALPLFARLELLLAGFDRTFLFDVNGGAVIRKMPLLPRVKRTVPLDAKHQEEIQRILAMTPTATLSDDRRILSASWRAHEQLRRGVAPPSVKPPPLAEANVRYTLQAKDQPLGPFLTQLCKQLQLECEFSSKAKTKTNQMISFEVEKANLQKLLTTILEPAALDFSLQKNKLLIKDKGEP